MKDGNSNGIETHNNGNKKINCEALYVGEIPTDASKAHAEVVENY